MEKDFDCAVIGGGVAGLMTAARLGADGWRVVLLERDLLGSGATTSNHGIVHSGALYANLHPEVVPACQQAQVAYESSFQNCVTNTESCWYIGSSATMHAYRTRWNKLNIAHEEVEMREIYQVIRETSGRTVQGSAVRELIIDTHALIADLAARCVAYGVELVVSTGAQQILIENGSVRGVQTAQGVLIAPNIVVCAGIGTRELLERSGSSVGAQLKSRLEMMMAYPGQLSRPIIGLEFGSPALAPAASGDSVLVSRYGAVQRWVRWPGRWPVPSLEAARLASELQEWLRPGLLDDMGGVAWVCSKTEHSNGNSDQWGTEPNYAVIDHRERDGVTGWWTLLPGKMTLALHASRDVVARISGTAPRLTLPASLGGQDGNITGLIASTPWAAHREAELR